MNGMDATNTAPTAARPVGDLSGTAAATAERKSDVERELAMQSAESAHPGRDTSTPASPDPLSGTDRYRLATPFTHKL